MEDVKIVNTANLLVAAGNGAAHGIIHWKTRINSEIVFDMWLKEYTYNMLLQPMHYILYVILISSSLTLAGLDVSLADRDRLAVATTGLTSGLLRRCH